MDLLPAAPKAPRKKKLKQKVMNRKRKAKELLKLEKERNEELMKDYQLIITSEMCGGKNNFKSTAARMCRINLLERLRLRSPKLPVDLEDIWARFVAEKVYIVAERYGEMTGYTFVTEINEVLKALKCYYNGKTLFNKGSRREGKLFVWDKMEGDPLAFENYVKASWKKLPKSTVAVCI